MAANMFLNQILLLIVLMQAGLVASAPVQKVITNHCDGQDCEIKIQYHDDNRDLSLKTNSTDSVLSAHLDIAIARDGNSDQNDLVTLMGNVLMLLSSMIQTQQDNHQQLDNLLLLDIESQPSPTPRVSDFLRTSSEPEITTISKPEINLEAVTTQQSVITTTQIPMQDCSYAPSTGQYTISPLNGGSNPFQVICDRDTTSGGWIVIQRRFDGSVDFDRNWVDYENGFGSLEGEFWLGLSKMHTITSHGTWKLRFDLEDFDGNCAYAEYGYFQVGNSASDYRLTIRSYSGTAGDGMIGSHSLNGMAFTTKDRDNDQNSGNNCAISRNGWWHNYCTYSGVTAHYYEQGVIDSGGMSWYPWKSDYEVLRKTEMKIRRIG